MLAEINCDRPQLISANDMVPQEDLNDKICTLNATKVQLDSIIKTCDAGKEYLNAAIQNLLAFF
ncbi:hypothetical protein [cyanobacterium endosymbiont of Epithemia turgida]|uniref:hypothetical protein n=1 Tax=cyanobacterium endosymbiont of Epithemia turgida TaxID=718217 RepID=UPI0005C53CEF|nr:hypothetical protein [cyanobacterium endosymbiont of Epithemia turgida]